MPEFLKRSSPIELEYHSLRVMNDCEILRNNDIRVPAERESPLSNRLRSTTGAEGFGRDDPSAGFHEGDAGLAPAGATIRRVAMACALVALAGVGIGLIALLTTVGSKPVKAVIEIAPVQPGEQGAVNVDKASAARALSAKPAWVPTEMSFNDRFQVARSGAISNEALQSRTERRPLGRTAELGPDKVEPDLGIVEHAKPVKTVAIDPALKAVVNPVLGYVPAAAASAFGGGGARAGQHAIAVATKPQGEGLPSDTSGQSSHQEIEPAAVEPVVQEPLAAEPEKSGTVTASVNMREKSAKDARIVAVIPPKTKVGLGSCDRWWCEVTYSGATGFIGKKFIQTGS